MNGVGQLGRTDILMDCRLDGMDGGRMDGLAVRWTDGVTDGWTN